MKLTKLINILIYISILTLLSIIFFYKSSYKNSFNSKIKEENKQNNEVLDTIKIILIGNSITYYNSLPRCIYNTLQSSKYQIKIDSSFSPGSGIESLISKIFYSKSPLNYLEFPNDYKVWAIDHPRFKDFAKFFNAYDIIYLQTQGLNHIEIYDILKSIDVVRKASASVLLFENYISIFWNSKFRATELVRNETIFKSNIGECKVKLVPVGSKFNEILNDNPTFILTDNSNHPTQIGSQIICELISNEMKNALNKL